MTHSNQNTNLLNKQRILKAARVKDQVVIKVIITPDFSYGV